MQFSGQPAGFWPKCATAQRATQPSKNMPQYDLSQVCQQQPGQQPTWRRQPNSNRICGPCGPGIGWKEPSAPTSTGGSKSGSPS